MNWYKIAQSMTFQEAAEILEVSRHILHEPKKALEVAQGNYRRLIKIYHPDVYKGTEDPHAISSKINGARKVMEDYFSHVGPTDELEGRPEGVEFWTMGDLFHHTQKPKYQGHSFYAPSRMNDFVSYIVSPIHDYKPDVAPYYWMNPGGGAYGRENVKHPGYEMVDDNSIEYLEEKYDFSWDMFVSTLQEKLSYDAEWLGELSNEVWGRSFQTIIDGVMGAVEAGRQNEWSLYAIIEYAKQEAQRLVQQSSLK